MKKLPLFVLILLSFTAIQNTVKAQYEYANEGVINIVQDARIDSLLVLHKQLRAADSRFEGFRIQLFMESGNDAVRRAEAFIQEFEEEYPEWPAYLSFGQPYYRVRIGNFRTRLEAEGALNSIKRQFMQAFITSDLIEPPELTAFPTLKETTP